MLVSHICSDKTGTLTQTSRPSSQSFHGVRLKRRIVVALLASERILNAMMSWTIVTQVQAEVQAASTVTPSDSAESFFCDLLSQSM